MSALLEKPTLAQAGEDFANRAQRVYDENLRDLLERTQMGKFVAIEPETERYFVADTGTAALIEARNALPDHMFYLVRVGYAAAATLHGYGHRNR